MTRSVRTTLTLAALAAFVACGGEAPGEGAPSASADSPAASAASGSGLSETELEQGIGPIRDLELAAVDPALAEEGEAAFKTKCSACHKLGERYVGPELGDVLDRRRPEFVMNMILNANEMVQKHPEVKALLAQFYTPMPVQVTDLDEARAILEYLRAQQSADTAQ